MDDIFDHTPANENRDPFLQADTALDELYRLRREVLSRDSQHHTFAQWRKRQAALVVGKLLMPAISPGVGSFRLACGSSARSFVSFAMRLRVTQLMVWAR